MGKMYTLEKDIKALKRLDTLRDTIETRIENHFKGIIRDKLEIAKTEKEFKLIKKLLYDMPDILGKDLLMESINRAVKQINNFNK